MESARHPITIRPSVAGDEPELKRLWQTVFGDSEEFITKFFNTLYAPGIACVALWDGKLVSAGYCLPGVVALGKNCSYIYAVATSPAYRGLGAAALICRRLVDRAFENGADIVATLPATEPLTKWYEKVLHMKPTFRKGAPGAEFPDSWHRFADFCGTADSGAPDRLWAVGAPGINTDCFTTIGWNFTFE